MKLHEKVNVNKAVLPRLLPTFLFKLHLAKLSLAFAINFMGILTMSLYSLFGFVTLLAAGITALCAGIFGILANKHKFLVLHGGSVFLYSLSFYLSLVAYMTTYAAVGGTYVDIGSGAVLLICLLLLVLNLVVSALGFGVELIVIYVADCQRRLAIEDMRRETSLP